LIKGGKYLELLARADITKEQFDEMRRDLTA
jgi:hypothetical protein